MGEKFKVSDDIEKNSKLPVPIIVISVIFALGVIIFFVFLYTKIREDSDWFLDILPLLIICSILLLFPVLVFYWIYTTMRLSKNMKKHIENGTVVIKKATITKFSYYYYSDRDFGTEKWYYIIACDWIDTYSSKLFERAFLTWWYYEESIDKESLQKKGIPSSPRDPLYNTEAVLKRIKEIDDEIDLLTEEKKSKSFFSKIKINSKINDLNSEKNKLFPPSLICGWRNLYIWDEVTVLVDPDNPKNYEMRI